MTTISDVSSSLVTDVSLPPSSPSPIPYQTELYNAIEKYDMASLAYLLENHDVDLGMTFEGVEWGAGKTPLNFAIESSRAEAIALLLDYAAQQPAVLTMPDKHGYTPLMAGVSAGNLPLMTSLLTLTGGGAEHLQPDFAFGEKTPDNYDLDILTTTRMWVDSGGNRALALDSAVVARNKAAAETFLSGREEPTPWLLEPYLQPSRWTDVEWLVRERIVSYPDRKQILEAAAHEGKAAMIGAIVNGSSGRQVVQSVMYKFAVESDQHGLDTLFKEKELPCGQVLQALCESRVLPDSSKVDAIRGLLDFQQGMEASKGLINRSLSLGQGLNQIGLLVDAGAPAEVPITWMALNNKTEMLENLVANGGQRAAIHLLTQPHEALKGAGVFFREGTDERVLFATLSQTPEWTSISDRIAPITLRVFLANLDGKAALQDALAGSTALRTALGKLVVESPTDNHLKLVKSLVDGKAPTEEVVIELARMNRTFTAQKLFMMGADVASAMNQLYVNAKKLEDAGDVAAANAELNAFHQLGLVIADNLLSNR